MVSSVTSSSHSVPSVVQMWTFRTLPAKIFSSCTNIVAAVAAAAGPQLSPLKTLHEPAVYSPVFRRIQFLCFPLIAHAQLQQCCQGLPVHVESQLWFWVAVVRVLLWKPGNLDSVRKLWRHDFAQANIMVVLLTFRKHKVHFTMFIRQFVIK